MAVTSSDKRHVARHSAVPAVVGLLTIVLLRVMRSYAGAVIVLVITRGWTGVVAHFPVDRQMRFGQKRAVGSLEAIAQDFLEQPSVKPQNDATVRALERRRRPVENSQRCRRHRGPLRDPVG